MFVRVREIIGGIANDCDRENCDMDDFIINNCNKERVFEEVI